METAKVGHIAPKIGAIRIGPGTYRVKDNKDLSSKNEYIIFITHAVHSPIMQHEKVVYYKVQPAQAKMPFHQHPLPKLNKVSNGTGSLNLRHSINPEIQTE